MENKTEAGKVKRHLDLKEKIRAQVYFEVYIYHHPLFLIYGDGGVSYEVTSKDMNEAIPKALQLHQEGWPTNTEEDEPSYIKKYQVIRLSDKDILDKMWDGSLGSYIYMRNWEPGMKTETLIKLFEKNEPNWFEYRAHYIEKIWELNLLED